MPQKHTSRKNGSSGHAPKVSTGTAGRSRRRKNKKRRIGNATTTANGTLFLKGATAAPDFNTSQCCGVPDLYAGKSLMKQFVLQQAVQCGSDPTLPTDTYFVVAPTPGVAYWSDSISDAYQPSQLVGVPFADASSIFDLFDTSEPITGVSANSSKLVDRFRFCGLSAELECNMNQMDWAGTIQVAKTQLRLVTAEIFGSVNELTREVDGVTGIANLKTGNGQVYTGKVSDGCYSVSMNTDSTFEWNDVLPGAYSDAVVKGKYDNQLLSAKAKKPKPPGYELIQPKLGTTADMSFVGPMVGMDAFDTIIFKVSVPAGASAQAFTMKVWQNIEFSPVSGSLFSEMAMTSPAHDQAALESYKLIASNLPVAVIQADNPDFWKRVLRILKQGSSLGTHIPGSAGEISKGVNTFLNLL